MPSDPLHDVLDDLSRAELRELAYDLITIIGPRRAAKVPLQGCRNLAALRPGDEHQLDLYHYDDGPVSDALEDATRQLAIATSLTDHDLRSYRKAFIHAAQSLTEAIERDEEAAWRLLYSLRRSWNLRQQLIAQTDEPAKIAIQAALRALASHVARQGFARELYHTLVDAALSFQPALSLETLSTLLTDTWSEQRTLLDEELLLGVLSDANAEPNKAILCARLALALLDGQRAPSRLADDLVLHVHRHPLIAALRIEALEALGRIEDARMAYHDAQAQFGDDAALAGAAQRLF